MASERHHLFVSYASINDDPLPGVETGWVTELVRGLKRILAGQLGRRDDLKLWMDYELHGNDAITPTIEEALLHSDTILLVLSPAYLASAWCRRELSNFLQQHQIDSGRVFMVEQEPIDKPEALNDLKGFRFYEQDQEGQITQLGWPAPDPKQLAYYQRVDDLGRSIAKKIQQIEAERAPQPATPKQPDHTVLLSPVTDDLNDEREQLRRYLEQQNIRVLPESGYYPPQIIEERITADLEQADLYVQLLSAAVGMGNPAFLHQCAQQSGKPLLLWCREGLDSTQVKDEDHRALLQHEQLIISDRVELQHQIQRRLQPQPAPPAPTGEDIFLFVNHAPEDRANLQPLLDELEQRNIGYALPLSTDEAGSPAAMRQDLEQNLLVIDALLMLYYDAPATWAREQLMFWRRTAIKREQPPRGLGVCKEPDTRLAMRLPGLQLIDCTGRCPRQCLDNLSFLNQGAA